MWNWWFSFINLPSVWPSKSLEGLEPEWLWGLNIKFGVLVKSMIMPEYDIKRGNKAIIGNMILYLQGKSKISSLNPFFFQKFK